MRVVQPGLELWSEQNQTGDAVPVPASAGGTVALPVPFGAAGAANNTDLDAELYTSPDTSGDPVATVGARSKTNFGTRHHVASVNFVEP
ncbi:hypothetical protein [Kitasatospora sp. NPDC002965]|uniref:hypothetical protein n=1 Tax=Kitasatospora sp. NPDC002965 TaxID=3154775 RepID=UPI0033AC769A